MREENRERMIRSALVLMGEQGIEATSFSQVLEHSGAPRGSIYYYFPRGKAQMIEAATRYAGDMVVERLVAAREKLDSPSAGVDAVADLWTGLLDDSDFLAGCPVVAATLEGERSPDSARDAARQAFARWEDLHAEIFRRAGLPDERARSLASVAISAIEGAVILSRAQRSSAPLERVVEELRVLVRAALAE